MLALSWRCSCVLFNNHCHWWTSTSFYFHFLKLEKVIEKVDYSSYVTEDIDETVQRDKHWSIKNIIINETSSLMMWSIYFEASCGHMWWNTWPALEENSHGWGWRGLYLLKQLVSMGICFLHISNFQNCDEFGHDDAQMQSQQLGNLKFKANFDYIVFWLKSELSLICSCVCRLGPSWWCSFGSLWKFQERRYSWSKYVSGSMPLKGIFGPGPNTHYLCFCLSWSKFSICLILQPSCSADRQRAMPAQTRHSGWNQMNLYFFNQFVSGVLSQSRETK